MIPSLSTHPATPGTVRRALVVIGLGVMGLTACGSAIDDAGAATTTAGSADGSTATPVTQGTSLPPDWPVGLDLPSGANLLYSTVDADGMSLLFDAPQDLPAVDAYFDSTATALGYRPESDNGFVDMLSRSWTDGTSVISVTATPVDGRTSGVLLVRPAG